MRKSKTQELLEIENERLIIKNKKERLIYEAKNKIKNENEKNQIILFIVSIVLIYLVYLFYRGDLSVFSMPNVNMNLTLVSFIKYTFLLWVIIRVIKSLLSFKENGLIMKALIKDYGELTTAENGNDKFIDSRSEIYEKISQYHPSAAMLRLGPVIFYSFLFVGLTVFLDYLSVFLFNSSKAGVFLLLGFPIINSILGIIFIYSLIKDSTHIYSENSTYSDYTIRPFLNYIEIFILLSLAIGIFSFGSAN